MVGPELKNKPLVEVLVELRWELDSPAPNVHVDPDYTIALGRLYDRIIADYPEHEQLPSAMIPDELAAYVVQHRFRQEADSWPLVQIGPGIFSVNQTASYSWTDFRNRSIAGVEALFSAYPTRDKLRITSLLLRYIDAKQFDAAHENVFAFLSGMMGVHVALPDSLFAGTNVDREPEQFALQSSFRCSNPPGLASLGFATGHAGGRPALIWETTVRSTGTDVPTMPEGFAGWIESAHKITHEWFFRLIAGELQKEFE